MSWSHEGKHCAIAAEVTLPCMLAASLPTSRRWRVYPVLSSGQLSRYTSYPVEFRQLADAVGLLAPGE